MGSRKTLGGGKSRERKGSGEREREGEKRRGKRENRCHWESTRLFKDSSCSSTKAHSFHHQFYLSIRKYDFSRELRNHNICKYGFDF